MKKFLFFAALAAFSLQPSAFSASLTLTWQDNSNNETGFTIERAPSPFGQFQVVANVGADVETYVDNTLAAATTYRYRVAAYNAAGASDYSNIATATTLGAAPAAPGDADATPPPGYTPPEPTVTLNAGESLRVVASVSPPATAPVVE